MMGYADQVTDLSDLASCHRDMYSQLLFCFLQTCPSLWWFMMVHGGPAPAVARRAWCPGFPGLWFNGPTGLRGLAHQVGGQLQSSGEVLLLQVHPQKTFIRSHIFQPHVHAVGPVPSTFLHTKSPMCPERRHYKDLEVVLLFLTCQN